MLFSVFLLKFPLVSLLWWFIVRNKEWPVRPPKWSEEETREILAYLVSEADRCKGLPDAPARLRYLQRRGLERRRPRGRRPEGGRRQRRPPHRRAQPAAGPEVEGLLMERGEHADLLDAGVAADGRAFRALLDGRDGRGPRGAWREAAALYRASWEVAPPRSYGRLVAHLKSAVLAGDGAEPAADWVDGELAGACDSPTSCYALAVAALVRGRRRGRRAGRRGDGRGRRRVRARRRPRSRALAARDAAAYRGGGRRDRAPTSRAATPT